MVSTVGDTIMIRIQIMKWEVHNLDKTRKESTFSSPVPKAQMSFPDRNSSFVCHCCLCHTTHFTFPSTAAEPLSQLQINLAQCIL